MRIIPELFFFFCFSLIRCALFLRFSPCVIIWCEVWTIVIQIVKLIYLVSMRTTKEKEWQARLIRIWIPFISAITYSYRCQQVNNDTLQLTIGRKRNDISWLDNRKERANAVFQEDKYWLIYQKVDSLMTRNNKNSCYLLMTHR